MTLTVNAKAYNADRVGLDSVGYNGPAHTLSVLDDIQLGRTAPKPVASFSGVGKSSARLARTVTLTGALTPSGQAVISVAISIPVGTAGADVDSLLNDMGSYLSSASAKLHAKNLQITF